MEVPEAGLQWTDFTETHIFGIVVPLVVSFLFLLLPVNVIFKESIEHPLISHIVKAQGSNICRVMFWIQ